MVKVLDRSKWDAANPERQIQILRILDEQDMTFTGILIRLDELAKGRGKKRWSRLTLTLYLKSLVKDRWIDREKKGRKVIYSLNRKNPDVMNMLGSDSMLYDLRIKGRVNLYELDEEKFMLNWLTSIKFGFLNIIQDYMLLGKAGLSESQKTRIQQFTQAHIQDIEDIIASYGEILAKRVGNATMREERIWEVRNDLHRQVKKVFLVN